MLHIENSTLSSGIVERFHCTIFHIMAVAFVFKLCPLQKKIQIIENKIKLKLKYVRRTGSGFFREKIEIS